MNRAIILRYDSGRRHVRAAGAHGMDIELFADAPVTVESAPIAATALSEAAVIEVTGDVARIATTQIEKAQQLEQRIDLAREIHEGVVQRPVGVSMALDGDGDLPHRAGERCATETQASLSELRAALQRPLGRAPRETSTTLVDEVKRLARLHPELGLTLESDRPEAVPAALEPLFQAVLAEAVRNVHKHARARRVEVSVRRLGGAFALEITNDGVSDRCPTAGMGLRLAALEAMHVGGVLEFGKRPGGTWQVRLVVPADG